MVRRVIGGWWRIGYGKGRKKVSEINTTLSGRDFVLWAGCRLVDEAR